MDGVANEVIGGTGMSDSQASQLKDSGRLGVEVVNSSHIDGRNNSEFDRIQYAKLVLEKKMSGVEPTGGQVLMAKLLAKNNSEKSEWEARPPGMAVPFADRSMFSDNPDKSLFKALYEVGAVVLTSPVRIDGKLSFVGVNNKGVFLMEGVKKEGQSDEDFEQDLWGAMRVKFDKIWEQESSDVHRNSFVDMSLTGDAVADFSRSGKVVVKTLDEEKDGGLVEKILKEAVAESIRAPFISTADYRRGVLPVEVTPEKQNIGNGSGTTRVDLASIEI